MAQLQHAMSVKNLDQMGYFSCYSNRNGDILDTKLLEVKRDQAYIDLLNETEQHFYDLMMKGELPELCERDYVNMEDDEQWQYLSNEYKMHQSAADTYKERADAIKEQLKELADQRCARGNGVTLTKFLTKGQVDYTKIPELQGVDLEAYRKASFTKWRINVT